MKNIQVIDGAVNCLYDIFAATEKEFSVIFQDDFDIAFIEDVRLRVTTAKLGKVFAKLWNRRVEKKKAKGIHGILFYEMAQKKVYYPTRRDEEAIGENGERIRATSRASALRKKEKRLAKGYKESKRAQEMSEFTKAVERALRLSAKDARKTARMYGTPVYYMKGDKIIAEKLPPLKAMSEKPSVKSVSKAAAKPEPKKRKAARQRQSVSKAPKKKVPMSAFSSSVGKALRLAAKDARKTAKMYGTPIIVVRNGKVVAEKP